MFLVLSAIFFFPQGELRGFYSFFKVICCNFYFIAFYGSPDNAKHEYLTKNWVCVWCPLLCVLLQKQLSLFKHVITLIFVLIFMQEIIFKFVRFRSACSGSCIRFFWCFDCYPARSWFPVWVFFMTCLSNWTLCNPFWITVIFTLISCCTVVRFALCCCFCLTGSLTWSAE